MKIENITVKYDDFVVLNDLSLQIPDRQITCILGESGIGKTTLLKVILGLIKPLKGRLIGVPEKKAAVFQENRLFEEYSAVKNIQLAARNHLSEQEIVQALAELNVIYHIDQPVAKLSGGMARRCAILRALLTETDLIVMDEPFKGLDEENLQRTMTYLKKQQKNRTMLLVLHSLEQANQLADQIILL